MHKLTEFLKSNLLLLFLLSAILPGAAQRKVNVMGNVYDRLTTKDLLHANVAVLKPDSTVAAETEAYSKGISFENNRFYETESSSFRFELPVSPQPYTLRISKEGYDTLQQPLDLSDIGRKTEVKIPPIYLTPTRDLPSVQLDEVVVKTSKVKFYHKGDTIVYNADAFMLPEGSSLDALIAKLPGVEIRDGGKIYVNGQYVESLLLNGKDFFKGNQEVMRQNLGAYTVKDIAVYEKTGQISRLLGAAVEDDKEFVMDVRLKKDYMGGWMGNNEVGYGTDDRYSARLFDMYFNNNARFTFYGNINNVNNTNRPEEGTSFGATYSGSNNGITKTTNGGFDYLVEDPRKVWKVNGNVDAKYLDTKLTKTEITESFLSNNSFQTSFSDQRTKPFSISTTHTFKYDRDRYYIYVNPSFNYNRTRSTSGLAAVEFSSDVQQRYDIDKAVIDAIFTRGPAELRQALINRNRYNRENRANAYKSRIITEQSWKMKGSSDAVTLWLEGKYDRDHAGSYTDQRIDYGFNGADAPLNSSAFRRASKQYPAYEGQFIATSRYIAKVSKSTFSLGGEYRHHDQRRSTYEFLADSSAEDEVAELPEFSVLSPDLANTNYSKLVTNVYKVMGMFSYASDVASKFRLTFDAKPQFHVRSRALRYNAFLQDGAGYEPVEIPVKRTSNSFNNCTLSLSLRSKDGKFRTYAFYRFNTEYAELTDMIDIPNTSDPLNVWRGNPDLKDGYLQDYSLSVSYSPKDTYLNFGMGGQHQSRAQVKGYTFNSLTGVRVFQTVNVNGNQNVGANVNLRKGFRFGVNEIWPYVTGSYTYSSYVNMIGEDGPMKRQMVKTDQFRYQVGLEYGLLGKYRFGAGVNGTDIHSHMDASRNGDTKETRTQIVANANLKLPFNLAFDCKMDYYIYSGVDGKGLNPDQCILSANLTYTLNSNWSFKLQGYDLLAQQRPYTNVLSASGRVQTIVNTLPRYMMLTATYKFNTKKK